MSSADRQGVLIRQLQGMLEGRAFRVGSGTVTFPGGSQDSGNTAVDHGLSGTPVAVFTQSRTITAMARPTSVGASQFVVALRTLDGSTPGAGTVQGFYWLAVL